MTVKAKMYRVTQGKALVMVVAMSKDSAIEQANLRTMGLPKAKIQLRVLVDMGANGYLNIKADPAHHDPGVYVPQQFEITEEWV